MKYRRLGSTQLEVSEIGFGTWGLGGTSYGPVDDSESARALQRAFDVGITFYDSADLYGNGHSEVILGRTLKHVREKIVIASKGGTLPHSGFYMPQDFSAAYIQKALEASLQRLETDYIDLYQLHSPKLEEIRNAELRATLDELKRQGKIREYGISVRAPKDGIEAIKSMNFRSVQANLNLIDHRAMESGLTTLAQERGVGIIARTPLCFGFLTGGLSETSQFDDKDHRKLWPKEQLKRWADSVALFEQLYKSAGNSPAQLALRFCLFVPGVSTVIPGMMNVAEVEENSKASDLPQLSKAEYASILEIYSAHQFYDPSSKGL